jgi:hypothetical protein
MKNKVLACITLFPLLISCSSGGDEVETPPIPKTPPYSGTIFLDPDILTEADPSIYITTEFKEITEKQVFDRRVNAWIEINALTFFSEFADGTDVLVVINPEFGTQENAKALSEKFSFKLGQLPKILRKDIDELWIHKGVEPFGGGNRSLLIHTGQSDLYELEGNLEETLIHEASHTSLDDPHASSEAWLKSQELDDNFISTYARDNAEREDIAESFLMYLAVKYRSDKINPLLKSTIESTIPNRLSYFDAQNFDLKPFFDPN